MNLTSLKVKLARWVLAAAVLVSGLALAPRGVASAQDGPTSSPDLSPSAWASIQQQITAAQYAVQWDQQRQALLAANSANGFATQYTSQGVQVHPYQGGWQVTFGAAPSTVSAAARPAAPQARAERVQYDRPAGQQEWFRNTPEGVEHGFNVTQPVQGGQLALPVPVETGLSVHLSDDGTAVEFTSPSGETVLRYADLHAYDAAGSSLPSAMRLQGCAAPGEPCTILLNVDATAAVYPVTIDPIITSGLLKLTAFDGSVNDRFGAAVAIGQGLMAVGAAQHNVDGNAAQGAVYLFAQNGNNTYYSWQLIKQIVDPAGAADDEFGFAVALEGDVLAVGAPGSSGDQGVVDLFYKDQGGPGTWGLFLQISASDGAAGDRFGSALSMQGGRLAVGAPDDNIDAGSIYLYGKDNGGADNWGELAHRFASDGSVSDRFGFSVSLYDEFLVAGAPFDNFGANTDQGSAYVFSQNQGGPNAWSEIRHLNAPDGHSFDMFGISVSIYKDTLVVGAPFGDGAQTDMGQAYVFRQDQYGMDHWGLQRQLAASDGQTGDLFGSAVAITEGRLAVGAPGDDYGPQLNRGSLYLFGRNLGGSNAWGSTQKLTGADSVNDDNYGMALAFTPEVLAVGVPLDDLGANTDQGSVFAYTRNESDWFETVTLNNPDGAAFDYFGASVSVEDNLLIVGAYLADVGANADQGAAYVFERSWDGGDNWGLVQTLTASDGAAGDYFGDSVDITSEAAVVGAPRALGAQGKAYVFGRHTGSEDNWGEARILTASDGAAGDRFGESVAISYDTVAVGAPNDDTSRGSAYIFARNQAGAENWGQVRKVTASGGAAFDFFGFVLDMEGDKLLVGAPDDNSLAGSAYLFYRNQGGADLWGQVKALSASDASAGALFGSSVGLGGDSIVVGAPNADAAYVFERNLGGNEAWGEAAILVDPEPESGAAFGQSVAISGDRAAVGAPYTDVNGDTDRGRVVLFERNQGGLEQWGYLRTIQSAGDSAGDYFGQSVSLSGDFLAVGIPNKSLDGMNGRGEAAVYHWLGNTWVLESHPLDPQSVAYTAFGFGVALSGNTLAVSAPWADSWAVDQGLVYIFERNRPDVADWALSRTVSASDGGAYDYFGYSIAFSDDELIVGAPYDDLFFEDDSGSAYIFTRDRGGPDLWGQADKLVASVASDGDGFGYAVGISGDTAIVGAPFYDGVPGDDMGAAFIYQRNLGGADQWGERAQLTASDAMPNDHLGYKVAISGASALASAPDDDNGIKVDQGAVYAFERNNGGADAWDQANKLSGSDSMGGDRFGLALAMYQDVFVAGAPLADVSGREDQGAAYVYGRIAGNVNMTDLADWGQRRKLTAPDGQAYDHFGMSAAIDVDLMLIGAYTDDIRANQAQGSAYLFERNWGDTNGWGFVSRFFAPAGEAYEFYGAAVAISGDTIAIGSRDYLGPHLNQGSAYVYRLWRLNRLFLPFIHR